MSENRGLAGGMDDLWTSWLFFFKLKYGLVGDVVVELVLAACYSRLI